MGVKDVPLEQEGHAGGEEVLLLRLPAGHAQGDLHLPCAARQRNDRAGCRRTGAGNRHACLDGIARRGGDRHFVLHTLRLATLSPRIVRAALSGELPDGFSLQKMRKIETDDWEEQERLLGFPPAS